MSSQKRQSVAEPPKAQKPSSSQLVYSHQAILSHLSTLEGSLNSLKAFLKATEEAEMKSAQTILQATKQINEATNIQGGCLGKDKIVKKLVSGISQWIIEKQKSQIYAENSKNKITVWLERLKEILNNLKAQARELQVQKATLTQPMIANFQKTYKQEVIKFHGLRQSLLAYFSHNMVRDNCLLLEDLTNKMQQDRRQSKKK